MSKKFLLLSFLLCLISVVQVSRIKAQTPGLIYKPAAAPGNSILDINSDGYSSSSSNGFISDDESESEIPFKPFPIVVAEPDSDLGPGPDCGFTDLVKSADNETVYTYSDGINLFFRFRLGGTASNSKGYSVLVDTDQKFGFTGHNPDPNATAGNPGFEVEIVLRTNFGVGIYNVDGLTTGIEIGVAETDRPYEIHTQKSIALSTICDDPDYFYDFYVAYADLPFTSSTPVRLVGNTVINPKAALGNNGISDLGGVDDQSGITDNLWEDLIDVFPPTSGDDILNGSEILKRADCPSINTPIAVGATTVSGTSSEADGAIIEVFKDGVSIGTTTVSANTWSLSGITALTSGEEITATAEVTGIKSTSIGNCNPAFVGSTCSPVPVAANLFCASDRRIVLSGLATGATVRLYNTATGFVGTAVEPTAGSGAYVYSCNSNLNTSNCNQGGGCPTPLSGSYYYTVQESGSCESNPSPIICIGVGSSIVPTISTNPIVETTNTISGNSGNNAAIQLFINNEASSFSTTANGTGNWTITGITGLSSSDVIFVNATQAGLCPSKSANNTVQAKSFAPVIQGSYCTNSSITTISGISSESAGAIISVYRNSVSPVTTASILAGTTTVNANGSWTLSGLNLSAGTFIAATAQTSGELVSNLSTEIQILSQTIEASLNITSSPVTAGDASITGTGTNGNIIQLYLDNVAIEGFTAVVSGGTWTISGLDAASAGYDVLYAEGIVTVTAKSGALCESSPSNGVSIACKAPNTQTFTPLTTITECETQTITFQLGTTENFVVYQLIDQAGNNTGASVLGNGSSLSISTGSLNTSMTSIAVKALRIGITCETIFGATAINVNPLPAINLSANPVICQGETTANLSYSGTTNNPNQYSIDFDAIAETEGFFDVSNEPLTASPIVVAVPGTANGGVYNANLVVTNTSTGCVSSIQPVTIEVVKNVLTQGTLSNPTFCGGSDGAIQLTGLLASTAYTVTYTDDGISVSNNMTSDASGNILISGLDAGVYAGIQVAYLGCISNQLPSIVLSDPGAANIIFNSQSNPTTCGGSNGTISIMNLVASTVYDVTYSDDGIFNTVLGISSDAGGNLTINNLNAGDYTNISVTDPSACKSNSLSGPFTLADPAIPTITLGTNPSVVQGTTSASLSYSSLTGGADQYSIDFDVAAEAEGFVDVSLTSITGSPINLVVPATATQNTYNGIITVNNSSTLCQSAPVSFAISITASADVTPPAASISGQPAIVNNATPFNITIDFGEIVTGFISTEVLVSNGSVTGFTDNGNGTFTVEITPDGSGDITINVAANVAQDLAGNNNTSATPVTIIFDNVSPAAPTVNLLTTNDVTPVITGTNGLGTSQPAGETLTVTVNGATYTVTPDASGNWSVDTETATPTSGTLGTFNDGTSYEVVATVTDAASNSASDATSNEVSIDTTAPATPTVNTLTTSDNIPELSGTAEIGSTVVVVINGVTFTTTADASGNWSVDTETATPTAGGPFT
ncbi:Ig-like domain-containing protein, partial [Marivirga lumbricoides]